MTTTCQPRKPQAQATGMAATSASIGTTTKMPTRARCPRVAPSSSRSGRTVRTRGSVASADFISGPAVVGGHVDVGRAWPGALVRSAEVVIVLLVGVGPGRREGVGALDAYVTVTYEAVS